MRARHQTPGLVLPFAVVGFAAGWLSDGFLANPLIGLITHHSQLAAGGLGGFAGAALGALLAKHARNRDALGATRLSLVHLGALVVAAGLFTGAGVGLMETASMWGAQSGALNGALSAVAFIPVCAMVLAAAHRAERARHGSIVAGADRRAVWGILATGLAVMTLLGALDVPAMRGAEFYIGPPWLSAGLVMAVLSGAAIAGILIADVRALGRVTRIGAVELEARDPEEARYAADVPSIDLGLGDDVHARMTVAQNAYRSRARAVGMLLGSVAEARRALGRALLRGGFGVAVAAAVLAGHAWAATPRALAAYEVGRCSQSTLHCHEAGVLYQGNSGVPADPAMAEQIFMRGCYSGDKLSCDEIYQSRRARGEEPKRDLPYWYTHP